MTIFIESWWTPDGVHQIHQDYLESTWSMWSKVKYWYLHLLFFSVVSVPIIFVHQIWVGAKCEFPPNVSGHQVCIWGNYFSAWNVRVCPMWMCTKCEWTPSHYTPAPSVHLHLLLFSVYLHPLFFCYEISECTQCECVWNVRVHPIWMCMKCQSAPNVNVHQIPQR